MKHLITYNRCYISGKHMEKAVFYQWYWTLPKKQHSGEVRRLEGAEQFLNIDVEAAWKRLLLRI